MKHKSAPVSKLSWWEKVHGAPSLLGRDFLSGVASERMLMVPHITSYPFSLKQQ